MQEHNRLMCWYCHSEISHTTSRLYPTCPYLRRTRRLDGAHIPMDLDYFDLGPLEGFEGLSPIEDVASLPTHSGPTPSRLNQLAVPAVHLDAGPFLCTLRQVYKDEFAAAVAVAVLKFQEQILELERAFPKHTEGSPACSTYVSSATTVEVMSCAVFFGVQRCCSPCLWNVFR